MRRPKIGVSMLFCLGKPFRKMMQQLAQVDTKYIEIVDDGFHSLNKKRVAILNEVARSTDKEFTVHGPFADMNIASPSKSIRKATMKRLEQSMIHASTLNAGLWIFHPGNQTGISMFYPGQEWKQNIESIRKLQKFAKGLGLEIAVENLPEKYGFLMKKPEDFVKLYEESDLDIGIVLDVGHANLEGQTEFFIKRIPTKIAHIHVSDNMGENDQHLGIGYGKIDWQHFAEMLREANYQKNIMVESIENVQASLQRLRELLH